MVRRGEIVIDLLTVITDVMGVTSLFADAVAVRIEVEDEIIIDGRDTVETGGGTVVDAAAPAVGLANQEIGQDGADIDDGDQVPGVALG